MRPATLAEAYELMIAGEPREAILSEFLDSFYLAPTPEQRLACLRDEPRMTGDTRLDALAGAVAEYLAKQYRLPSVPGARRSHRRGDDVRGRSPAGGRGRARRVSGGAGRVIASAANIGGT